MSILAAVEAELTKAEEQLADAAERYAQAVLAESESKAALQVATEERDRVQNALFALNGKQVEVTQAVVKDDEERKDAPVDLPEKRTTPKPKPRPEGPKCPSCGKPGTLGPQAIQIRGQTVQVTTCSHCSHQVW